MAKEILLTQGYKAIVDDELSEVLSQWKWYARVRPFTVYACRHGRRKTDGHTFEIPMHRQILSLDRLDGKLVDHVDGNGLNNQISNLRIVTQRQNVLNQKAVRGGTSRFKGIYFEKFTGHWKAQIGTDGRTINLGRYPTEEEAARAYDVAAKSLFGEYARTNF